MTKFILPAVSALALVALPAIAQAQEKKDDQKEQKAERPVTQTEPSAVDVVATPANDLNIRKDEVPAVLLAAEQRPYTLRGLDTCRQLAAEIGGLDAVLGEDVDLPQAEGKRTSIGRVAQSAVGSLIPFRGLIREISGANRQDREMQAAIYAGVARRSFLKGVGQGKGCRYPARSATIDIYNQRMAALDKDEKPKKAEAEAERDDKPSGPDARGVRYVSRPVVQRAD